MGGRGVLNSVIPEPEVEDLKQDYWFTPSLLFCEKHLHITFFYYLCN
jgi:hypothetical protein